MFTYSYTHYSHTAADSKSMTVTLRQNKAEYSSSFGTSTYYLLVGDTKGKLLLSRKINLPKHSSYEAQYVVSLASGKWPQQF